METQIKDLIFKIGIALLTILSPIKSIILAVGFLILGDFVTGIWASLKRKQHITSFKMRRTIVKALAYEGAVIFGFVMETYLLQDIPVVKVIAALIAITEAKSFFENINVITGIDFWNEILNRVQGKPLDITQINLPKDKEEK